MYDYMLRPSLEKIFSKLDTTELEIILKKINQVREDPHRYKNLRAPLQHLKRVHIKPFVLVFSVVEAKKLVIFENYKHHDDIYKR